MKNVLIFTAVVLIFTVLMCWPFAIIWAVNTLAGVMVVHYTFWNWLAVVVIQLSTFSGLAAVIRRSKLFK